MATVMQNWKLQVTLSLFSVVIIYYILPILLYFVFVLLTIASGAALAVLYQPGPFKRRDRDTFPKPPLPLVNVPLSKVKPYPPPSLKPKLLSPRIDRCLQEVLTLTLKHHVIPTYNLIAQDEEAFFKSVTPNIWGFLLTLLQRMGEVDTMNLVSQDVVQLLRSHFENFRGIHYRDPVPLNKFPDLAQFPYLESPEQELNFLHQVCEVLLCISLPKEMLECMPIRIFIKEFLACRILQPTIDMICDPDYINQKMLIYLKKREEAAERGGKKPMAYKYKDFEDFMSQIKKCEDVEELQALRQQVITDIIQAKAVYKMKQSNTTGLHGKQFPIPIPAEKLKVLMGRDLELYIRQLGTAKTSCDRQLRKLGEEYDEESTAAPPEDFRQGEKPLGIPFETIMKNEVTRVFFLQFLEDCGCSHLLCFWLAAESLEDDTGASFSSSLSKLYEDYLSSLSPEVVHVKPDLLKPIEDFLLGKEVDRSTCLSTLAQIKESVYEELREGFYQNFIWSDHFGELMHRNTSNSGGAFNCLDNIFLGSDSHADEESNHRKRLGDLKTRLKGKDKELSLMPPQVQSSHSLSQRKRALQKDRSHLREEIKNLEHYLDHTEEWFDTIGQWSVEVHSVDIKEDDKDPLFIMIVHRLANRKHLNSDSAPLQDGQPDVTQSIAWQHHQQHKQAHHVDGTSMPDSDDTWSELSSGSGGSLQSRSGWVLGRHLSEFETLHKKVTEICPNLQFPPLPKWLNPFQRPHVNSAYWVKYRAALQAYLCMVLKDERLNECEEVFNFVSSASDNLVSKAKPAANPEKKTRGFSLSNVPVFQAIPGIQRFTVKDNQLEDNSKELDSTAEYVYLLVSEIFELDHFSRVLRKQLVELVQLTYGKSIDREVQDKLNWVFSEPMLIFYLETFKNGMWPGGTPAPPAPTRSDEDKAATKEEARGKFLKSSPQALQTILGQRNCQIGMRKIFELLQEPRGNKQLFYALFEVFLYSIVPELEKVELDDESTEWKDA
jgi:sorting nexin-25